MAKKTTVVTTVPMSEIRAEYARLFPEGHWFDRGSMQFFATRLPKVAFKGPGGTFFVTSEQFESPRGNGPRNYTVRQFKPSERMQGVDTIGPFNERTQEDCIAEAKRLAAGGAL